MIGWWTGFPYWLSFAIIGIGGILGVMYSVPLRRALVTGSDLPYPEGVAAAWDKIIDRSGEIFFHQLALLRGQLLAYVEMAIGALRMGVFTGNDPS